MKLKANRGPKGFRPIELTITIENETDLYCLWHRFLASSHGIANLVRNTEKGYNVEMDGDLADKIFEVLDVFVKEEEV